MTEPVEQALQTVEGAGKSRGRWTPRLKSGAPYDEVVSGIQKMIRRGKEREALVLAQEMFDSGYHSAVARRLMIIASEDIGLANPALVSQVYTFCVGYLLAKKETGKPVEPLALIMSIILLSRSPKNRECDDAQIAILRRLNGRETSAAKVIEANPVIVDRHTDRGKARLRALAKEKDTTYEHEADMEFLTQGSLLYPHLPVDGNPWGHEVASLCGYDYEPNLRGAEPPEKPNAGVDQVLLQAGQGPTADFPR